MSSVIDNLRTFNCKERFLLVGMALGNTDFVLCEDFRSKIGAALQLQVPGDAFAAMDYHLDWLFASLHLSVEGTTSAPYPRSGRQISATQEDIDLLVAYVKKHECHIILLEAKGTTGFINRQLRSKAQRLSEVFGHNGNRWASVVPHFAVVSPREPKQVDTTEWPDWMHPGGVIAWVEMRPPPGLRRITRCDANGKASAKGMYWRVVPVTPLALHVPHGSRTVR